MYLTKLFPLLCLALCLFACQNKPDEDAYVAPEILYNQGLAELEQRHLKKAITLFERVERDHPFSEWATHSLVMEAYSKFSDGSYEDAITSAERFLHLHPRHSYASYMTYLKAMALYYQITPVQKDQSITEEAKLALDEVIARYPATSYARDASLKRDLTIDHLAGKEMEIGRFYLENRQVIAAMSRFQKVVSEYQTTSHTPEALYRLVEVYTSLGVMEEAKKYTALLNYNFPDNVWYERAYLLYSAHTPHQDAAS